MESVGWEICPARWILLFILAALVTYYILKRLLPRIRTRKEVDWLQFSSIPLSPATF